MHTQRDTHTCTQPTSTNAQTYILRAVYINGSQAEVQLVLHMCSSDGKDKHTQFFRLGTWMSQQSQTRPRELLYFSVHWNPQARSNTSEGMPHEQERWTYCREQGQRDKNTEASFFLVLFMWADSRRCVQDLRWAFPPQVTQSITSLTSACMYGLETLCKWQPRLASASHTDVIMRKW